MSCLTNNCYPWRKEFPEISKVLNNEEVESVESLFSKKGIDRAAEGLEGVLFLPDGESRTVQLIHLARIGDDESLRPLTEKQERIFEVGQRTDKVAVNWLNGGCGLYAVTSLVSFTTCGPTYALSWIPASISTLFNVVSTGVSYLSTGCYPHMASVEGNKMQNTFHEAKRMYTELGSHLISIYEIDSKKAEKLAEKIDIQSIINRLEDFFSDREAVSLTEPLAAARRFVLEKEIPDGPVEIRNSARLVLLSEEVEHLQKQNKKLKGKHL